MSTLRHRKGGAPSIGSPAAPAASAVAAPPEVPSPVTPVPPPPAPRAPSILLDVLLVLGLLGAALYLRLVSIDNPNKIVFDEVHFTQFATWYLSGNYFVDIHPPLVKLIYAWVLKAQGFVGPQERTVQWWSDKGNIIGTSDYLKVFDKSYGAPYIAMRVTSAVAGAALIPATYLSARALGLGRVPALLAAVLMLTETVSALQARIIVCDAWMYLFDVAALGASFASVTQGLSAPASVAWVAVTGFLLGCAVSVKFTALGIVATVAFHQAAVLLFATPGPFVRRLRTGAWKAALMVSIAAVLFFSLWVVHVQLLPYSGHGDTFSSPPFKAVLVPSPINGDPVPPRPADPDACPNHANAWSDCGFSPMTPEQCTERGCCWDPTSPAAWCYHRGLLLERPTLSLFAKVWEVIRASIAINHGGAVMVHAFMSEWREWPMLMAKSVPFGTTWEGGLLRAIANPFVHGPVTATVAISAVVALLLTLRWAVRSLYATLAAVDSAGQKPPQTPKHHAKRKGAGPASTGASSGSVPAAADDALECNPPAWAFDGGGQRSTPLWIAFITLWLGYMANLVPYELIDRSKFIYHYVPALLVGILLLGVCIDALWAWAIPGGGGSPLTPLASSRARLVGLLCTLLAVAACAGYAYWGIPFVHGMRLSDDDEHAREWLEKWSTRLPPGVVDTSVMASNDR